MRAGVLMTLSENGWIADRRRLTLEGRIVALFNGRIKRVHVDVDDPCESALRASEYVVPDYEVGNLNPIGSTRAATIATSIRLGEWKPCRKRKPLFAIRGLKRACGNSKPHSKTRAPVVEVAKAMKRTEAAVRQKAKTIGIGLGHRR
jgi:hypothetical protein